MGVFDIFSDHKTHEKAYGRGVKNAQNADMFDKMEHALSDLIGDFLPKGSTESQSYEAGYHSEEAQRKKRSTTVVNLSSSSESKPVSLIGWCIAIAVGCSIIYGIVYLSSVRGRAPKSQLTGTIQRINGNELNLRSGPGTTYPIVRVFRRGEEIVSFRQEHTADGYVWVQAATLDGQKKGWIVQKYLSK